MLPLFLCRSDRPECCHCIVRVLSLGQAHLHVHVLPVRYVARLYLSVILSSVVHMLAVAGSKTSKSACVQ